MHRLIEDFSIMEYLCFKLKNKTSPLCNNQLIMSGLNFDFYSYL